MAITVLLHYNADMKSSRKRLIAVAVVVLVGLLAWFLYASRDNPSNPLHRECNDALDGETASMCAYN